MPRLRLMLCHAQQAMMLNYIRKEGNGHPLKITVKRCVLTCVHYHGPALAAKNVSAYSQCQRRRGLRARRVFGFDISLPRAITRSCIWPVGRHTIDRALLGARRIIVTPLSKAACLNPR